MCRSIRTLHNFVPPATDEEMRAAALQYVRKIAGVTRPSQANAAAFRRFTLTGQLTRRMSRSARPARATEDPPCHERCP